MGGVRKYPVPRIGERFSKWTVIGELEPDGGPRGNTKVLCRCDCGQESRVAPRALVIGESEKCRQCQTNENIERFYKHGGKHRGKQNRLYGIWLGMRSRCYEPRSPSYPRYGAAGIKICPEWLEFKSFQDWALSNGYADGLQIDRRDNGGNYEPANCRWLTPSGNARNRKSCHFVTAWGETKTLVEWSEDPRCLVACGTLGRRLSDGVAPEIAMVRPTHKITPKDILIIRERAAKGETHGRIALDFGVHPSTIRNVVIGKYQGYRISEHSGAL